MSAIFSLKRIGIATALFSVVPMFGCQSSSTKMIRTETNVDLDRFMGRWYVLASIPTPLEKNAFNAVETYERKTADRIQTTFEFNRGASDGPKKIYRPTAVVEDTGSGAVWGMQFLWPFKAEYRIVHVDEAYETTVIGRSRRDYVWIMARTPHVADDTYQSLTRIVADQGYDVDELVRVPHG